MRWFALPLFILIVGCTTPYQHASESSLANGGYDEQYLGDDTFLITVRVNAFTEKTTAFEYFHRRAVDITRLKGYDRYEVIEIHAPNERSVIYIDNKPHLFTFPRVQGRIKCYRNEVTKVPAPAPHPKTTKGVSAGTAWPVRQGYVVTNNHVVRDHPIVLLIRPDGTKIRAAVALRIR